MTTFPIMPFPSPEKAGRCPACNQVQFGFEEKAGWDLGQIRPFVRHGSSLVECSGCGFTADEEWWFQWDYQCLQAGLDEDII